MVDIKTLVDEKIESDADFQAALTDLSDEDKEVALNEKRTELINAEYTTLEEKAKKAEEIAKNQEIRAKKAEAEAKKPKEESELPKKSDQEYSLEDTIAIINDKVTEKEDIETVKKFAKLEGISIADALKSPIIKTILSTKAEERKTAQATNTGVSRKATSKISGEDLLEKFNQGEIPEKEEDLKRVIEQRWTAKEK